MYFSPVCWGQGFIYRDSEDTLHLPDSPTQAVASLGKGFLRVPWKNGHIHGCRDIQIPRSFRASEQPRHVTSSLNCCACCHTLPLRRQGRGVEHFQHAECAYWLRTRIGRLLSVQIYCNAPDDVMTCIIGKLPWSSISAGPEKMVHQRCSSHR